LGKGRSFGGTRRLHLPSRRVIQARSEQDSGGKQSNPAFLKKKSRYIYDLSLILNFRHPSPMLRRLSISFNKLNTNVVHGRAAAQRLDVGFPPRRPRFSYGQYVGFVVDKAALGQVFSEYFGFPCQSFHRFLHYHNHRGLTQ
jgi:hypothetical protein